ncbi:probable magnesium transporter NIPA8 [Phalaenopsis equestris]|uniref:probable magnesium transporter NIPA8 n=1 Tax=Phalaenopsis equestris TaxID=78828 RepID=UPI0009E4F459|nr:probable magnesium transporter NIPA8 [Phalaenopsis equestris]
MGQWVIGAIINIVGSIAINFGTNLLKLGHDQRERLSAASNDGSTKLILKPIIYFHSWRVGILFFVLGNSLNFFSFAYAAQSLLAALGSIQFVSNIAFSYFVLSKTVTIKVLTATFFIVFGNIFLVSFGNHQSPVYTPEQLAEKYSNLVFLLYCLMLIVVVIINHYMYRKGAACLSVYGNDFNPYWRMILPFSYAIVSGAIGSCSVLFAKSLSNMLRLTMSSNYHFHSLFTYSLLLLFFSTAGFWLARLNEGLSLFDAILIVPMFQIAWTFFSICTGFIYFQEYQVFDALRITMFLMGMSFVFIGITLLAPDDVKGDETKDSYSLISSSAQSIAPDVNCSSSSTLTQEPETNLFKSSTRAILENARTFFAKAKATCSLSVGLSEESINASSVLVMPMVSARATGFRPTIFDRAKFGSSRTASWSEPTLVEDDGSNVDIERQERVSLLS